MAANAHDKAKEPPRKSDRTYMLFRWKEKDQFIAADCQVHSNIVCAAVEIGQNKTGFTNSGNLPLIQTRRCAFGCAKIINKLE
ncbi:MAG: hypothetical protein HY835_11000 [Anaerolineae bacterium]|nr:hypothetical protein [Anaerolineae bacterium]